MQPGIPAPAGSPAWVAAKWVQAYYGVSYTWPSPGYWATLARPYMTEQMWRRYEPLVAHDTNPGDAAYFAKVRANQTVLMADIQVSTVERDAPNTAVKRYVLVTFQLEKYGLDEPQQGAPWGPVQVLQCIVVRPVPASPWLVASFNSPDAN
jgi:hypothetical protein